MRVHEMIVAERQHMADLLASLSQKQLARQSLCDAWTVHEVGAHLVTYLRFGQLKIYLCMLAGAGNFAPGNERLARMYARRSTADLARLPAPLRNGQDDGPRVRIRPRACRRRPA